MQLTQTHKPKEITIKVKKSNCSDAKIQVTIKVKYIFEMENWEFRRALALGF